MCKCQVQNNYPLIYHYSKRIHVPYFHSLKYIKKKKMNTENTKFYLQVLQAQSTEKQGMSLGEMLLQCFQVPL